VEGETETGVGVWLSRDTIQWRITVNAKYLRLT